MNVLIIDYGMSNLGSVRRAFEECGARVSVSADPADLDWAERIVLPGVGAFADGMTHLHAAGWPEKLRQTLANPDVHLLGICLGMQLLATTGYENGATAGLGFIPGEVTRLTPGPTDERIPHVGWNEVHFTRPHPLTGGIKDGTDFYFVHSYHFRAADTAHALAHTPYCGGFASMISMGNIMGTQFHSEKSARPGFQLIRNFLSR
jgi:glutamine amidotransferase